MSVNRWLDNDKKTKKEDIEKIDINLSSLREKIIFVNHRSVN